MQNGYAWVDAPQPVWIVGDVEYYSLQAAVNAACEASSGGRRSLISQLLRRGQMSYQGYRAVLAHFHDGSDLRLLAADEDGNPDLEVRSTAFLPR